MQNDTISMVPKIWGPGMWIALHSISFCYPENPTTEDKENYKKFYESLGNVLPCIYCRDSYNKFIKNGLTKITDDVFTNRETLTKWMYYIHEAVNNKLCVNYNVSYDDVVDRYESFRASCHKMACEVPKEMENNLFKIANNRDCTFIPVEIAKQFVKYAKMRGLDREEFYVLNDDNYDKNKRNKECNDIINTMRENGIGSLEYNGNWEGLPTVNELKLIVRLCSNFKVDELVDIIKKIPNCNYKKIYKLF